MSRMGTRYEVIVQMTEDYADVGSLTFWSVDDVSVEDGCLWIIMTNGDANMIPMRFVKSMKQARVKQEEVQ